MKPRFSLLLIALISSLVLFAPVLASTPRAMAETAKKKKKSPPKKAAATKVTSKSIIKWKKQGISDDEIVSRASDGGFRMTPLAKTSLKKAHISKSLMAALDGKAATPVAQKMTIPEPQRESGSAGRAATKKPVNLAQVNDPNDIDFDSVAPPAGIPERHIRKDPPAPKKTLDRSTRPSAPFEDKAEPKSTPSSHPRVADASPSGGSKQKRVVYTATAGE